MAPLHGLGATVVLGAALLLAAASAAAAMRGGASWVGRASRSVTLLVAAEVAVGAIEWLGGGRPREALHYLYGLAALIVLPFAATFASEAPPRPRAVVMAVAGLVLAVLVWRSASTG